MIGTAHPGHYRNECKHGKVISQCRCPGPKVTVIVPCPRECSERAIKVGDRVAHTDETRTAVGTVTLVEGLLAGKPSGWYMVQWDEEMLHGDDLERVEDLHGDDLERDLP